MASKLKCRKKTEKSESSDRISSNGEESDDFPNSNIASKINVRRLPKRTPTAHVKTPPDQITQRRASQIPKEEDDDDDEQKNEKKKEERKT